MDNEAFEQVEQALRSGGPAAGFAALAGRALLDKDYRLLLEVRLLEKRWELGLPLIQSGPLEDLPEAARRPYEEAFVAAAREVGGLFLGAGDIPSAWPYFRAISEPAPVAAAIEKVQPGEGLDRVIEIAFLEGVHPYKGFELILACHGACRAISSFEQYPARAGRDDCARLLVRTLHRDLVERLRRTIAEAEGTMPETERVPDLIAGRDWLFGEYSYYIDTSHLLSVVRYSGELDDPETLGLAVELTDYGRCLSQHFQYRGDPPFENVCADYGIYLRALLGQDPDSAVAHFRRKVAESDPEQAGTAAAQVLVALLARLGRYGEAIDVSVEHLPAPDPGRRLVCPSTLELCQMAGDWERLRRLARQQGDLVGFVAAALKKT